MLNFSVNFDKLKGHFVTFVLPLSLFHQMYMLEFHVFMLNILVDICTDLHRIFGKNLISILHVYAQ